MVRKKARCERLALLGVHYVITIAGRLAAPYLGNDG